MLSVRTPSELERPSRVRALLRPRTGALRLPIRLAVVLQEFPPDVLAGVEPGNDRVHDLRRTSHKQKRQEHQPRNWDLAASDISNAESKGFWTAYCTEHTVARMEPDGPKPIASLGVMPIVATT